MLSKLSSVGSTPTLLRRDDFFIHNKVDIIEFRTGRMTSYYAVECKNEIDRFATTSIGQKQHYIKKRICCPEKISVVKVNAYDIYWFRAALHKEENLLCVALIAM